MERLDAQNATGGEGDLLHERIRGYLVEIGAIKYVSLKHSGVIKGYVGGGSRCVVETVLFLVCH